MASGNNHPDLWEYTLMLLAFGTLTGFYLLHREMVKHRELTAIAAAWVNESYDGRDTEVKCDTSDPDGDGLQFCVVDYYENGRHRSDLIQCAVKFSREPRCEIAADLH